MRSDTQERWVVLGTLAVGAAASHILGGLPPFKAVLLGVLVSLPRRKLLVQPVYQLAAPPEGACQPPAARLTSDF